MTNEEKREVAFPIRGYGKSELALFYSPKSSEKSAVRRLKRWITKSPGLELALQDTGASPTDKYYTPAQVRLIVEALGEP